MDELGSYIPLVEPLLQVLDYLRPFEGKVVTRDRLKYLDLAIGITIRTRYIGKALLDIRPNADYNKVPVEDSSSDADSEYEFGLLNEFRSSGRNRQISSTSELTLPSQPSSSEL